MMKSKQSTPTSTVSRRNFLATTGGATFLVAGYVMLPGLNWKDQPGLNGELKSITAWIRLGQNGQVTIFNPSTEMGQGTMTATAVLLAEELDVDWKKVKVEFAPIEPKIYGKGWGGGRVAGGSMITVGSSAVRGYFDILRVAGAQARYVLLYSVSKEWKVPISELTTRPGLVVHQKSNRTIPYGEITSFITQPDELPEFSDAQLTQPADFKYIGQFVPRVDVGEKTNGKAIFATDIVLPGMLHGVITRSPVNGSKPTLQNEETIRKMKGVVEVVKLDHGIGVVATTIFDALNAKKRLEIQWSEGARAATHNSISAYDDYSKLARQRGKGKSINSQGDVDKAFAQDKKRYQADYLSDYVSHAQMEPLNAVIAVAPDGKSAEAWVGSQAHDRARQVIAEVLGISFDQVTYHPCYLGGGFGRRSMTDYVEEAALMAKVVKKPLKLTWTREDDIQYGAFRPISLQHMEASVNKDGEVSGWWHNTVGTGDGLLTSGAEIPFYTIPNQLIERNNVDHGVRTKHWRAVGHGPNKYAIESFIDEIAKGQGEDELAFRMRLMRNHPRAQAVLKKVGEMSDWGNNKEGRAKGLAFAERSGSLSAGVMEISVNRENGKIKVHRVWVALDSGIVVQPFNAIAQSEGSVVMGLSSALKESITFKDGKVEQSNFHDYQLLRMDETPEEINIEFVPSTEAPAGIGEAALPMVGGALVSAFASLTGKRLRHMPFTPEKVLAVLAG